VLLWKGWGIVTPLVPLATALAVDAAVTPWFGAGYFWEGDWPLPVALALAALIVFVMGHKINSRPGRILIDPLTDETVELKTVHSLYYIPMQYWGVIILLAAALMYLSNIGLIQP